MIDKVTLTLGRLIVTFYPTTEMVVLYKEPLLTNNVWSGSFDDFEVALERSKELREEAK